MIRTERTNLDTDTTPRKMLRIIDFIEEQDQPVTADALLSTLGFTRSTLYRHLKVLSECGFITTVAEATYTLGPRIVELDYKIRTTDPLIASVRPFMRTLAEREEGIALLCRRYRERVLCIHQESGTTQLISHYERGRPRPLFRGAASRVILAHLRPAVIARLYQDHAEEFVAAELGATEKDVRASLRRIRRQGWDMTTSQVTQGVLGIAAPLMDEDGEVHGSLALTILAGTRSEAEAEALAEAIAKQTPTLKG